MGQSRVLGIIVSASLSSIALTSIFAETEDNLTPLILYDSLSKKHPDQAEYLYLLGGTYYKMGSWNKAIEAFKKSLTLDPNNPDTQLALAYSYLFRNQSSDDLEQSRALFNRVLSADSGYKDAQEGLKKIDRITFKISEPTQQIEEKEKGEPKKKQELPALTHCDKDLLKIAQNLTDKNNLLVAIIIYRKLIKEHPDHPEFYYQLARAYSKMQSYNKAIESFKKALELDPKNQDIMLGLAYANLAQYGMQDDLYTARALFQAVLKAVPNYTDAREGLRKTNQLLGIKEDDYERGPETGPIPVPVEHPEEKDSERETVSTTIDDAVTDILLYGFITKNHPEQPYYYYELGRSFSKMKDWNEAIAAFTEALTLQPDNEDARLGLAFAHLFRYINKTKVFESKRLFQEILSLNPKYTEASEGLKKADDILNGIVRKPPKTPIDEGDSCKTPLLEIAGELEDQNNGWAAIMFLQELIQTDPKNGEYYYDLGRAYVKVKSWEKAIDAFNKALELQPENADARVAVAYAYLFRYLSRCDLSESRILFDEVLQAFPNYIDAEEGLRKVQSILHELSNPPRVVEEKPHNEESEEKKKLNAKYEWETAAVKIAKELAGHHDFLGALTVYQELIEVFPERADYFFLLGRQHSALEQHCEAIAAFKQAIALKPDYTEALIALGSQYLYFNCAPEALIFYTRAVESDPQFIEALVGLANTKALLNMNADAERLFLEALSLDPCNTDIIKPYAAFLLAQRRYIESENSYRSLVALENAPETYRSTLFDIASHTSPTFYANVGGGVEREKNQFNNQWEASLSYTNTDAGVIYPIHDRLRVTVRGKWADLKQRNLVSKTTVFDSKFIGVGGAAEYFYNPYWSVLSGINFEWITNDNTNAQLHTRRSAKFEPMTIFRYVKDGDTIAFGEITDSYVFKNFDKNRVTAFTRECALLLYQHDFGDNLLAGADVAWWWFQDPIHNQEQDINVWAQAGLPYFEENLSCRYHSEYRQMRKETTGYYSFQYQWTHWLKFRWYRSWDFGGRCELLYWHGWRTIRGKNPQQQITTTALAAAAPVVTIEDQIDTLYLTLGYTPDDNFDISATGNYWHDSYDYTVWGGKIAVQWRF